MAVGALWWGLVGLGLVGAGKLAHSFQLLIGSGLLRHQGSLYPVKQSLEPADQLSLGNTEFCFTWHYIIVEWQRQGVQLFLKVWRERTGQLFERAFVDLRQAFPRGFIE